MLRGKDWPSEKKINFLSHNPKKIICVLSKQNFKNVSSSLQKDVVSGLRNLMDKGGCEERASGFQVKIANSAKIEDFGVCFFTLYLSGHPVKLLAMGHGVNGGGCDQGCAKKGTGVQGKAGECQIL